MVWMGCMSAESGARFAMMLGGNGTIDGVRLLSPKTIELMTSNHTADIARGALLGPGTSFGLGFQIVTDVAATAFDRPGTVFSRRR